jgi:hypothetical protein
LVKHHPVQLPLCLLVEGADPNVADALSHLDWRFPLRITEICHRSCWAMVHKPWFLLRWFLICSARRAGRGASPGPAGSA